MDKVRAFKDLVATGLGFGAAVGIVAFNEEQTGVILGAVAALGSLYITFFGGGNTED